MLVDGFLALLRAGILRRRATGPDGREAVLHAGFFVGNQAFYRELREMPREALELIAMTAISFTNTLDGDAAAKRAQRTHARFVNTAMVATLLGAVSSDQLEDGRVVSGAGGQHDLVGMAHALEGARSIIGVRGIRRPNRRTASNIVWRYANATVPRQLRDILVTEYGIADLRGKSDRDVIAAMLGVADSGFQPGLLEAARRAGKIEPDLPAARRGEQPGGADRGRPGTGQARGPAACVPAGLRDDGGRADARWPAHLLEVGRLRRPGADAGRRSRPRIRLGPRARRTRPAFALIGRHAARPRAACGGARRAAES